MILACLCKNKGFGVFDSADYVLALVAEELLNIPANKLMTLLTGLKDHKLVPSALFGQNFW